jgi:hypothetical protein
MGTTTSGLVYPEPGDDVQLWEHFQNLAQSVESLIRTPLCVVYKADASGSDRQFILSETAELVRWTAERHDTSGMHSTSVNPERITPDKPGIYRAFVSIVWQSDAPVGESEIGLRRVIIKKNGVNLAPPGQDYHSTEANNAIVTTTETTIDMNGTTDYFTAEVFQNTGNGKYLYSSGAFTCYMSVKWERPLFA